MPGVSIEEDLTVVISALVEDERGLSLPVPRILEDVGLADEKDEVVETRGWACSSDTVDSRAHICCSLANTCAYTNG